MAGRGAFPPVALPPGTVTQQVRAPVGADGTYTWTYPTPYAAGVNPIVEATAEAPANSTALFNVQTMGPPTNTQVKVKVNMVPVAAVSLVGLANLTLFTTAPTGTIVDLTVRAP